MLARPVVQVDTNRLEWYDGRAVDPARPHRRIPPLFVHPVILGAGRPYFPALDKPIGMTLLETRSFDSGVVFLRYEARERP